MHIKVLEGDKEKTEKEVCEMVCLANKLGLVSDDRQIDGSIEIYNSFGICYINTHSAVYGPYENVVKSNGLDVYTCRNLNSMTVDLIDTTGELLFTSSIPDQLVSWIVAHFNIIVSKSTLDRNTCHVDPYYTKYVAGEIRIESVISLIEGKDYAIISIGMQSNLSLMGVYNFTDNKWLLEPTSSRFSMCADDVILEFKPRLVGKSWTTTILVWLVYEGKAKNIYIHHRMILIY